MGTQDIYQPDLAWIHVEGYGFHWEQAAPAVLEWFRQAGIDEGMVVDLGCGGGQWLALLREKGYDICGVDVSAGMIRQARKRLPGARLIRGSFAEVDLPPCVAVTSMGEPLNYLDGAKSIKRVFRSVFRALQPGGLFIFDFREPYSKGVRTRTVMRQGEDWFCAADITEDGPKNLLVRNITTFRKTGRHYRRSHEVHKVRVYARRDVSAWLRQIGFHVRTFNGYGEYRFTKGQAVMVARKH